MTAGSSSFSWRPWILTLGGGVFALLAMELVLRLFVTSWHSQDGPIRTIRQYTESVATSTFEADGLGTYGNRRTGNPVVPGAPTILVVGDSHVVQEAVADSNTLGAVVERLSRNVGTPVNVRQYGWYDAAAPTYIANAPALLKTCDPQRVVVLMNLTDFGSEPLVDGWYWRMKIHPDMSIDLIDVRASEPAGRMAQLQAWMGRSSLLLSIFRRSKLIFSQSFDVQASGVGVAGPKKPDPRIARASVKGLKAAFGSRLTIFYAPFRSLDTPETSETQLFEACTAEGVHCVTTRPDMVADMRNNHRILRGFHNTAPGIDHLNEAGLDVVGTAIWRDTSTLIRQP